MQSFGFIFRLRPLKTHYFGLKGYLNQTSLNSISPVKVEGTETESSGISTALISEGKSVILKTLTAACVAFPISGPNVVAYPAA